ncbi:AAA domain-containing protein [bacterium]|jgi:ATP-dependent Clp protease ATP-binding subunit ClpB|nr:AAA domain-containing protein [bacterium]
MNMDIFTDSSKELLNNSAALAVGKQNATLVPLHTIASGIENEFCRSFFQVLEIPIEELQELVKKEVAILPKIQNGQLSLDPTMQKFIDACKKEAEHFGDTYISLELFILQWATTESMPTTIRHFFAQSKFSREAVLKQITSLRNGKKVTEKEAEQKYQILDKYAQNLTEQAKEGKLDPIIGRHEEIRRVVQILSRRTKNNPVLIGEPGVGKTAIAEGIAQRIINNDVPESLQNKKIYSLDLGLLIAGAKYQGEFEDRLKSVLKAVEESSGEIVLFIDELHMLVGTGASGSGGMDASNILKPALARGTLHCIGATTLKEYKQYIEKDAALERRFQPVLIEEPTQEDALSILRGIKEKYELHHGIRIKDQALVDAVRMASKHISDRFLPDKAIDLIDEAAAMVRMSIDSQPESIDKLDRKMRQLEIEKVALSKEKDEASKKRLGELDKELANLKEEHQKLATQWKAEKVPFEKINELKEDIEVANYEYSLAEREGDFAKASEIKYGKLSKLENELKKEQDKLSKLDTKLIKQEVDENDIATVLSRWTKIPVTKLKKSETEKLLGMRKYMEEHVIGQDEAVEKVSNAIQIHRAGLSDANRPIGSFLFLGPTGVGKTEIAKTLADFLFDDQNKLVRIDMSEYMERHAVARLIGSPPGYVGYEEGGQLTEQVRRNPYSVVLFDEIEKAHPEVFNIFLQILDEGHLTDGQGRKISFKNSIIIMTSNIGSDIILESKSITEKVRLEIEKLLNKHFRPEFLNRIDATVFFKMLTEKDVEKIAHIQIARLIRNLKEKEIDLSVSDKALSFIAKKGYVKEFGARPLKRAIQDYISVPLSQYILKDQSSKKIKVDIAKDKISIN